MHGSLTNCVDVLFTGTYTSPEGIIKLCEALKGSAVTKLK